MIYGGFTRGTGAVCRSFRVRARARRTCCSVGIWRSGLTGTAPGWMRCSAPRGCTARSGTRNGARRPTARRRLPRRSRGRPGRLSRMTGPEAARSRFRNRPRNLLRESRGRFLGARNPLNRHRSSRTRGGIRWTTPATPIGSGMPSGGTSDTTMSMAVGCTGPASGGRWMKQGRSNGGRTRCLSGWKRRHARSMTTGTCSSMSARPAAANIKRR